jgi:glycine cleavage system H protein
MADKKELEGVIAEIENGVAFIYLTDEKANELSDASFVELPAIGTEVKEGEAFANVETAKSVENLKSPVSGTVEKISDDLKNNPGLISQKTSKENFIITVKL